LRITCSTCARRSSVPTSCPPPFVERTLTGKKHHRGGSNNGHMVIPRRLMETGRIDALDQGVILSAVQGAERVSLHFSDDLSGNVTET
jgi:hypothetical protein